MDSYLGESALIETVPDLPALDVANLPMQQNSMLPGMGNELISLPGGIVMSKRTLLLLAAGIVLFIWMKRKK